MRFVVYGAGAIGGLVAACLVESGSDVTVIARGAHLEAIQAGGLTVESPEGRRTVKLAAAAGPEGAGLHEDDMVLLAMKSQDTAGALDALRRTAPAGVAVACLQNGVDNERAALRLFDRVYPVCVMCPAAHLSPRVVQVFSAPVPGLLDGGCYPAGTDDASAALVKAFRRAGFDAENRPDIMRWKYRKLLLNLGNAVEALCRPPGRSALIKKAQEEGEACLQAAGIAFASVEEDRARRGDLMNLQPVEGQKRGGGSSWQSLRRGTGSIETDYLNGEIVLLGRLHGIQTPVNALLQRLAGEAAFRRDAPGQVAAADLLSAVEGRGQ